LKFLLKKSAIMSETPRSSDLVLRLGSEIASRKNADPTVSYTAKLFSKGKSHIAKKFGEEAIEVVIATVENDRQQIIYESADLLYHWLVLLASCGISFDEVLEEMTRREGISGIQEKNNRQSS
jgi:phosphoribosyl-ATP pyrophosphohydrolase